MIGNALTTRDAHLCQLLHDGLECECGTVSGLPHLPGEHYVHKNIVVEGMKRIMEVCKAQAVEPQPIKSDCYLASSLGRDDVVP